MRRMGLEDGSDEVTELAGRDDADGEDTDTPHDREVAGTVFGSEDLVVDEANQEVALLRSGTSSRRGGEETFLCRAVVRRSTS